MDHPGLRALSAATLVTLLPSMALADTPIPTPGLRVEPWLVILLALCAVGYVRGVAKLWRKAGLGRGIRIADAVRFACGWGTLVAALVSPIDELAARAFSIHMIQHEMLMVVAAPLLATSRPLEAWAWALPAFMQRALVPIAGAGSIHHLWRQLTRPVSAWSLHALSIWIWHIPALFAAALANEAIHVLQHTSFLASALLFWSVTTRDGWRVRGATTVAMLFTTMLHTGALGLLLTFSPTAWYVQQASELIGLSALEDQQLGGLIMWVPGGFTYMLAALWIVYGWLTPPVAVSARNTR